MITAEPAVNFSSNVPIYSHVFSFEENFSPERAKQWMRQNYSNGYLFCGMYLFLIFSIKYHMRDKAAYKLRHILALWNAALAIFSTFGAIRSVPELYRMLTEHSLYHSVCYPTILEPIEVIEFWGWIYALSKLVEFGDTMFIVLRKNPLIFLHWYHHILTLLHAWFAFAQDLSYDRWFITMNYGVHSLMYSYYVARALGFSVPKCIMVSITFLQIVQMVIGCTVVGLGYYYRLTDQPCQVTNWNIVFSFCMYFSYLILFCNLFNKMYISPSKKTYSHISDNVKIKRK